MTARLRRMVASDLPAVVSLERELFPEDAWSARMFASELNSRSADRFYLVAEDGGEVVGYAGLLGPATPAAAAVPATPPAPAAVSGPAMSPAPATPPAAAFSAAPSFIARGQADVLTMAVARSHWGQRIGSALLESLLAEAARRQCAEVFLEVRADNPRARRLYSRHGFTDVGLRRGYYQPSGTDAIVMRRPMGPAGFLAVPGSLPGQDQP